MIKAIIFDLDGTIVDTELYWADAILQYLLNNNCGCSKRQVLDIVFGRSWRDIYEDLTSTFPAVANTSPQEMARTISRYHKQVCAEKDDIIIESSVKLLKELAEELPVIVVSGSPRDDVIHNLKLADVYNNVKFILGAEDYAAGKPDPAGFLKGAEMLNVEPENCLVFEDSAAGVSAAKAAGMYCVALSREKAHKQDVEHADQILSDLADFDTTMSQLNS